MKIKAQVFRDGTSQRNRLPPALDPSYFSVDERTLADWLTFVQAYAGELKYFNLLNQVDGDWAAFFAGDVQHMVDYVECPQNFVDDPTRLNQLAQPHLTLFLTFLKLLEYPQQQFKELTQRYLDFYYRDVLKLTEKAATPDRVHVVFTLAPGETHHRLPKGTLLSAGADRQGVDRQYALDEDLYINQAQVASVKTLSVEKVYIDLKTIHEQEQRSQQGFENVLRWAVGTPNQGHELPTFPDNALTDNPVKINDLNTLFQAIKNYTLEQITDDRKRYIFNQLGFGTIDDFKYCFDVHDREIKKQRGELDVVPPTDLEWHQVYTLIEKAYRKKINRDRRTILKTEHRHPQYSNPEAAFLGMMQLALGDPDPGDVLPTFPEGQTSLEQLYQAVNQTTPDMGAIRYVKEQLFMSLEDFRRIMSIQQVFRRDFSVTDWEEVYRLLEKAQTQKRGFVYPPIGRTEIQTVNATTIATANPEQAVRLPRFQPFLAEPAPTRALSLGVAITSPVLHLQEGDRALTLTLAYRADTFNRDVISQMLERGEKPFAVAMSCDPSSTQNPWLTIPEEWLTFQVGDFILEAPLKSHRRADLALVYRATEEPPFHLTADVGCYLRFPDGTLHQIMAVPSREHVQVRWVGQVSPVDTIEKYPNLNLGGNFTALTHLTLSADQQEMTTTQNQFATGDIGKIVMLADGNLYQITQFANAKRVSVRYWGYLPGDGTAKKYDQITFAAAPLDRLADLEMSSLGLTGDIRFSPEDVGNLLVWLSGDVYKLIGLVSDREATVQRLGNITRSPIPDVQIYQYSASGIYLNSLQFQFTLDANQPEIVVPSAELLAESLANITVVTPDPVIKVTLKSSPQNVQDHPTTAYYQCFKDLCLERAKIQVAVSQIQDLQLRNDRTVLSAKSPFEPFDTEPKAGASLYFAHPEVMRKKLDRLALHIQWMGLPGDFAIHYQAYSRCGLPSNPPAINNSSFQAQLQMWLNRTWQPIATQSLFATEGNQLATESILQYGQASFEAMTGYGFVTPMETAIAEDLLEQDRYFKLELTQPDFQHDLYPLVLSKVALATDDAVKALTVYRPYTPKIKAITLDYHASDEIDLMAAPSHASSGHMFQLHPFGTLDLLATGKADAQGAPRYFFLPQYDEAGALFLGIRDLQPPQTLTLLFQLISGSANADLASPEITWSYLQGDRWQPFQASDILFDSTNGLVDSGLLRLHIPATATTQHTLLPRGLHWLRATLTDNATAIPDVLDIRAQVGKATFVDQGNAPEHLSKPLAADSVQALVQRDPAMQTVQQPYSSFGGRMQETQRGFYTRVSERLRHKHRAVTRSDYERLVLERFPQIYKVKCLTQADQTSSPAAAQVTVVVIPDIANTAPFFPLEPKAPLYLLKEIEAYLKAHTSPFVQLVVKNPRYEPIQYRIAVRFTTSQEQGHYLKQLNDDLVRFLSPWAYEEQADIAFGSSIHSSAVIHFIETRPYVDYVANLKLIEQDAIAETHRSTVSTPYQVNESNLAQVKQVDSILVSAPAHIIDLITTDNYTGEEFEGIDYMMIGIDFVVI